MELKYRFLLKEINSALNMQSRDELKQKMLDEIKEYAKTDTAFLLELHKNLGKFVLFFLENAIPHIEELQDGAPF